MSPFTKQEAAAIASYPRFFDDEGARMANDFAAAVMELSRRLAEKVRDSRSLSSHVGAE